MSKQPVYYTSSDEHILDQTPRTVAFGGPLDLWGADEFSPNLFAEEGFAVSFDYLSDGAAEDIAAGMVSMEVFFSYNRPYEPEGRPPYVEATGLLGSCCKGGRIIVVGASGLITTSDDEGDTWTERTSGVNDNLWSVDFAQGLHTIVGENGVQLVSEDNGDTWEEVQRSGGHLFSISKKSNRAVAVGQGLVVLSRPADKKEERWVPGVIFDKMSGRLYGADNE